MHVGNDIVDLTDPETAPGAHHPRFPDRVCCPEEQRRLREMDDPNALLWRYWCAKESAFKALRKVMPTLPFSLREFRTRWKSEASGQTVFGQVLAAGYVAEITVEGHPWYLHAIARVVLPDRNAIVPGEEMSGVRQLAGDCSVSVEARRFLTEAVAPMLRCHPDELRVVRSRERRTPPQLLVRNMPSNVDISLSHHGRFVAYACALPVGGPKSKVEGPTSARRM